MKKPIMAEKETLTTEEAISLFGLSRRRFRRLMEEQGSLPFMASYGTRRLIIRAELERWLTAHPEQKEALKNGTYRKTKEQT